MTSATVVVTLQFVKILCFQLNIHESHSCNECDKKSTSNLY